MMAWVFITQVWSKAEDKCCVIMFDWHWRLKCTTVVPVLKKKDHSSQLITGLYHWLTQVAKCYNTSSIQIYLNV